MTDLDIHATEEALEYFEQIAREMVLLFPITMDEAIGRINRFWQGRDMTTEVAVNMLLHEEPDSWAKNVYYGRASNWWLGEEGLKPLPFP
jgi:hypothetical protein